MKPVIQCFWLEKISQLETRENAGFFLQFCSVLQKFASTCGFDRKTLEGMLTTQLIEGMSDQQLKLKVVKYLHKKRDVSFTTLVEQVVGWEKQLDELKEFNFPTPTTVLSHRLQPLRENRGNIPIQSGPVIRTDVVSCCLRCGQSHERNNCLYFNAFCFNCGIRGHIAKMCKALHPKNTENNRIQAISQISFFRVKFVFQKGYTSFIIDTESPISIINRNDAVRCGLRWGPMGNSIYQGVSGDRLFLLGKIYCRLSVNNSFTDFVWLHHRHPTSWD